MKNYSKIPLDRISNGRATKILTVCNYGQVRSRAMAVGLQQRTYMQTGYIGMFGIYPEEFKQIIEQYDLIIMCNKPNLEKFLNEGKPDHKYFNEQQLDLLKNTLFDAENKIIVCDIIGVDRWGDHTKESLRMIVNRFLSPLDINFM